jgi:uncharacterized DUF497 family protein
MLRISLSMALSLVRAEEIDLRFAMIDDRADYGETRFIGYGLLDGRPHCLIFTMRDGEVRPISLRRAHIREYGRYGFQDP